MSSCSRTPDVRIAARRRGLRVRVPVLARACGATDASELVATIVLLALVPLLGYAVTCWTRRLSARAGAWTLVVAGFVLASRICRDQPPGFRVLAICATVFLAMKAVVAVEVRIDKGSRLGFVRWLARALLWPGMRPLLFAKSPLRPLSGARELLILGLVRASVGAPLWTIGWLLLPLPVLFHRPFLEGVIWPLIGIR